jgi:hypothetical protein
MPDVRSLLLSAPLSEDGEKSCVPSKLPGPIYAVASPANGSGKTSLCCALVKALPGSTAIKFTTVKKDGSRCPRGGGGCACHSLQGDYTIIEDPTVIRQPGTDTGRLTEAGAKRVIWCLARPHAYEAMLEALAGRLDSGPLVIEGNSVLEFVPEAKIFFVIRPDQPASRFKESSLRLLKRSLVAVINHNHTGLTLTLPAGAGVAAELYAELERRRVMVTDLREQPPEELLSLVGPPS